MALTQEIQRRIKAKEAEVSRLEDDIQELRMRISAAQAYVQGLKDILPKVAKEEGVTGEEDKTVELRPGSAPDMVRALLEQKGAPMHITAILAALGREPTKSNRLSLSGTLARLVRENMVFTRPAPNTFGLMSMQSKVNKDLLIPEELVPEDFGK